MQEHKTALTTRGPEAILELWLTSRSPNTIKAYRKDITAFAAWCGLDGPEALARHMQGLARGDANALVLAFRTHLDGRGLAPTTMNRRLAAVRSFVKLGHTVGVFGYEIAVSGFKVQRVRDTRGAQRPEWEGLVEKLGAPGASWRETRLLAAARLLHDVALRKSEVLGIDLADLDLAVGQVTVTRKGKTQSERISLPVQTVGAILSWLALRGDHAGPLFVTHVGGVKRLSGQTLYLQLREHGERLTPHRLRHLAVTTAVEATGGDMNLVAQFSGHSDVRTIAWYVDRWKNEQGNIANMVAGGGA